ncbi:hypothetical protein EHF33_03115 [Deinococcus psychrotolerans]|uniref:Uncharacterized protein n=1 Tax=Deinococcus psychrotolerans TaxID=2489213 RepID=A0A3G8Y9P1_9DEIO|nr:hypothetical protein [Deinococcus psychrotolerans]AZI41865.1 hypothetical protein EHF33_03115 [Deinococcus psychrotolerans]
MTSKAVKTHTNPQGGATLSMLYDTGSFGRFGPGPTLWNGGTPHEPGEHPAPPANANPPAPAPVPDISRSLQNLIDRSGGADRTAELLFGENREHRARIRELEGQLPAQGATVLTPEQTQQWTAYQAINADPTALRTQLDLGSAAVQRETGRTLADASGANPDVLSDRLRAAGLRAEVRDIPAEGANPARREVRVLNTEGADQGELRTYAQQNWTAFMPALFPASQTAQGTVITGQSGAGSQPAPTGNAITDALGRRAPSAERVVVDPFATPSTGAKP